VTTLEKDADALLTFFDFPAEHWKHLRTSNVIESPFATVRLRQRVMKGAGSRTKGLLMAYKLLAMAQSRWRRLDGAHLLPLVRAGVVFVDGAQQTNSPQGDGDQQPGVSAAFPLQEWCSASSALSASALVLCTVPSG
jgi:putative transposase